MLTAPVNWLVSKPKKQPFYKTVTASKMRLYRKLIEMLPTGEWRVMRYLLNRQFRHEGRSIAPGNEAIGEGIGYTVRQVRRITNTLIEKGFLKVTGGGVGRGNRRSFWVDLWAILKAFAPDLLEPVKGDISSRAYNKELLIGRKWEWFAGVVGRSANFARRLVRAIRMDERETKWEDHSRPRITDTLIASLGWATGHQEAEA